MPLYKYLHYAKKLVSVSTTSILITNGSEKIVEISCTYYLV